jgi:hypothetical protein
MWQVQSIGVDWLFNASFEAGPAGEPGLACDGELRTAEFELGSKDRGIRSAREAGMEFADELGRSQGAGSMGFDQVFGLVLQLVEIGMGRKDSNWQDELPFVCPRSAY